MAQIFCFGDSITYGAWDIAASGWADRLRLYLDQKQEEDSSLYFLVYNLGVPGETTGGLISRFLPEASARIRAEREEKNIFIFAYGTNDSAFVPSQNKFLVNIENFGKNLKDTVDRAKKLGNKIFILNIIPVDEGLTAHPANKDKSRLNEYVGIYNKKIAEIAGAESVNLVDVNSAFTSHDYRNLLCGDGLHPNEAGHKMILAELLKVAGPLIGPND